MRVFAGGAIAFLIAAVAAPAAGQTVPKIGYINSQRILAEAPGRAEAEQQFEREVVGVRQQLQRMDDSLRALAQGIERAGTTLTAAQRERRVNAARQTEERFQSRADSLNQQMQRRQAELVRPIMEQLNRVLEQLKTEERYSIIFDVAAQGQSIVAADTTLDISPKVIARLRAAGPPGPATPATTGATQQPAGVVRPRQD